MKDAWPVIEGLYTPSETIDNFNLSVGTCRHCETVLWLHDKGHLAFSSGLSSSVNSINVLDFRAESFILDTVKRAMVIVDAGGAAPDALGFICTTNKGQFKCESCDKSQCNHLSSLRLLIEADDEWGELLEPWHFKGDGPKRSAILKDYDLNFPNSISSTPILEHATVTDNMPQRCCPPMSACEACGREEWVQFSRPARLSSMTFTKKVEVVSLKCPCGKEREYDGSEDKILVYSKDWLFTHGCMFDFWDRVAISHCTFVSHSLMMRAMHQRAGNDIEDMPSREVLRRALWSFLRLLNIPDQNFGCPCCSCLPYDDVIITIDGITLGFNRGFAQTGSLHPIGHVPEFPLQPLGYLNDKKRLRALLRDLCGFKRRGATQQPWTEAAFGKVLEMSRKPANQGGDAILADVLGLLVDEKHRPLFIPRAFKSLFKAIATDYAISSLFSFEAIEGSNENDTPLMKILHKATLTAQDNIYLNRFFPLLGNMVRKMRDWKGKIPPPIVKLMVELHRLARLAVSTVCDDNEGAPCNDYEKHIAYSPAFPLVRLPSSYAADASKDQEATRDEAPSSEDPCTKHQQAHPGLTPGMICMFCPHGFCLGFKIMSRGEGPKTVFDLVYHRFKKGPKWIVYDNACNLHRYCLRRRPCFFRRTRFFIDRMHRWGHIACHEGYNMDKLPGSTVIMKACELNGLKFPEITVESFNSQVAEQCNAKLLSIRTQCAYMRQENYMSFVRYFLYKKNRQIESKLKK
jgi:hypothetical protein